MRSKDKVRILLALTIVAFLIVCFLPRIPQSVAYHQFADNRRLWGIPNFSNVVSNLPFLVIGIAGLVTVRRRRAARSMTGTYTLLFIGVLLTGLGSAYYHLHPNNNTLVWDRIPMTIVFMSLLAATIAELISIKAGGLLLWPLLVLGVTSVIWWHWTELAGHGDLRLYGFVQFYPTLFIPLIIIFYYRPSDRAAIHDLKWVVIWYLFAKGLEKMDVPIFHVLSISGHTLKHLAAAISTYYFIPFFRTKYPLQPSPRSPTLER